MLGPEEEEKEGLMETLVGSPDHPPHLSHSLTLPFWRRRGSREQVGVWCQETGRQSHSFGRRPGFVSFLEAMMPKV